MFFEFNQLPIAIAIVSVSYEKIMNANQAFENLVGIPRNSIQNRPINTFTTKPLQFKKTKQIALSYIRDSRQNLIPALYQLSSYNKNSHIVFFIPLPYELLSEINQQEIEQKISYLSHEISTPLNGIVSMTELLLESSLDKDQKNYVEIIQKSSFILFELADYILFPTDKNNTAEHSNQPNVSIDGLLDYLRQIFYSDSKSKNIPIHTNKDYSLPGYVKIDKNKVLQILMNLTANSFKFTQEGFIVITVKKLPGNFLKFIVSDTGTGISKNIQKKVLKEFYQADKNSKGTGLGLFLSQKLVSLLGGEIKIKSPVYGSLRRYGTEVSFTVQYGS